MPTIKIIKNQKLVQILLHFINVLICYRLTDKFVTKDKQVSGKHKFDKLCSRSEIEHRLTQPATPKTNGMVERVNGTIKNATVKAIMYQNIAGKCPLID
jgi:transposase InsO family protein